MTTKLETAVIRFEHSALFSLANHDAVEVPHYIFLIPIFNFSNSIQFHLNNVIL